MKPVGSSPSTIPAPQGVANKLPPPWLVHSAMFICAFLVATSFLVGKAITPLMDPGVLTTVRFLLATALFAPYIHYHFGLRYPGHRSFGRYALISATMVGFFWLMFLSLRYTKPLNTSVLFTIVPGLSGLCSWLLLQEKTEVDRIAALVPALVGALWVIFQGEWSQALALNLNRGDAIFLGACLFMALYTPLVKLLHQGEPMAVMTFWVLVTGSCWLVLCTASTLVSYPWATVPAKAWLGITYLAFFTTIVTFFLTQWATLFLGPTRVMSYSYLYPPMVIIIESVLYQQLTPLKTMFGVLIILPAMVIIQKGSRKKSA